MMKLQLVNLSSTRSRCGEERNEQKKKKSNNNLSTIIHLRQFSSAVVEMPLSHGFVASIHGSNGQSRKCEDGPVRNGTG